MPMPRKPDGQASNVSLSVAISQQDHETLKALAEEEEVTLSWLVRRAIRFYLKNRTAT